MAIGLQAHCNLNVHSRSYSSAAPSCSARVQCRQQRSRQQLRSSQQLPSSQTQVAGQPLLLQLPTRAQRCSRLTAQAAATDAEVAVGDTYEVFLTKPLGIRFARGNDGKAYIVGADAAVGSSDNRISIGDRIEEVSASFGDEVWEARNFGQVIYAIKTRNGQVYLKLLKRDGDLDILQDEELDDTERRFKTERGGGNYGEGTKELQARNYEKRKEAEAVRESQFNDALKLFSDKKLEEALIEFENVLAMEPKNYVGDNFSRITQIYRVTQYNIACCYSAMGQVDAGMDALADALNSGFDQFKVVRTDPNLKALRADPRFEKLIDQYDEPVFNTGALKALRGVFSFGKKEEKNY
mmetsp:Transcript_14255/g.43060  ORF Transcript_14255/g.43060 Transcript_14255/m.43060 type:complete len:353 (-) Transcript_14255:1461-2519(-)|eukprot:CAMPEP_0206135298 /NCGR_PEP_ID=MMETSP1473-20131121/616_1 /ASSEMBLY_ACC=CAM_ASM_001109 /TAXON_ID=1461547 /ORGANISM="Stichococcus sp, Strain RCC1054" /LENGTH=352 /DNA_ID=CAMNT_0053527109 /DNA_START=44 /DNA_END=1102 /DNA_ORIENTATION=+